MKWNNLNRFGLMVLMALPLCGNSQSSDAPAAASTAPSTAAPAPAPAAAPTTSTSPLAGFVPSNVTEVIKLSKAGMGDDVVIAYVKNSHSTYNLRADDILQLKSAGVSSGIITAMLTHDSDAQNQSQPQNAPGPYVYNQQLYPPNGQIPQGQTMAQPYPQQAQGPVAPPPADMSSVQPPPPQPEVVPVTPGPDYYWAPGYWGWNGGWIWIGGGWYPHGYYGWGYRGGWGGYGYRGGVGFRGGFRGGGFGGGHR